ncbi:hypothetical protein WN943_009266 [Citrus x changshan-huyou]
MLVITRVRARGSNKWKPEGYYPANTERKSLELFKIEICAHKVLNKPVEIQVGGGSVVNREISPLVEVRPESDSLLIATGVAARGLGVKKLELGINFIYIYIYPPNHYEDYAHRVVRTGRAG